MTGLFPTIVLKGRPLFKREKVEGEKKDKTRKKKKLSLLYRTRTWVKMKGCVR